MNTWGGFTIHFKYAAKTFSIVMFRYHITRHKKSDKIDHIEEIPVLSAYSNSCYSYVHNRRGKKKGLHTTASTFATDQLPVLSVQHQTVQCQLNQLHFTILIPSLVTDNRQPKKRSHCMQLNIYDENYAIRTQVSFRSIFKILLHYDAQASWLCASSVFFLHTGVT